MNLDFIEFAIIMTLIGCGSWILVEAVRHGLFNARGTRTESELKQLRELVEQQTTALDKLELRLSNLEVVVTGPEYQASQRVRRATTSDEPAARERQPVEV